MRMRRFLLSAASLLFIVGAPADAHAENVSVSTSPGGTVRVWRWAHYNKDCKSTSPAHFAFKRQPKSGKVAVKRESFPVNPIHKGWAKCKGKVMPGLVIYYTAGKSASGRDSFSFVQDPMPAKPGEIRVKRDVAVTVTIK
jgi:hypothetical protein